MKRGREGRRSERENEATQGRGSSLVCPLYDYLIFSFSLLFQISTGFHLIPAGGEDDEIQERHPFLSKE